MHAPRIHPEQGVMSITVIKNARIVNEGVVIEGDLKIHDDRIEAIAAKIDSPAGAHEIDARGAYLLPGMIDDQVHFREPGLEHKGTFATESKAAVAGGVTSYMEMPNSNPQTVTEAALRDKHARAARVSLANYAFYLGATNDNLEVVKSVDKSLVCGVKVFMGASTGNMLVDNRSTLEGIFSGTDLLIATHCEDTPTIQANEARARERYGDDIPMFEHPNIRSVEACFKSSSMAVDLAKRHGTRLHILHLTTAKELSLFEPGSSPSKRITAEVCAHHLFFNDTWYATKGSAIKCNPAIKTAADQQALMAAVNDGRIDVIATDHAPHTREEKARKYAQAPSGLPLVQHVLLSLFEHVHAGRLTIEKLVEKTAHSPARLYQVAQRGFLREGYYADLTLIDPNERSEVDTMPVYSKCGWTPFAGFVFRSRVRATFVNGKLMYRDGEFPTNDPAMALRFERR
jgi:dihydroorotase